MCENPSPALNTEHRRVDRQDNLEPLAGMDSCCTEEARKEQKRTSQDSGDAWNSSRPG